MTALRVLVVADDEDDAVAAIGALAGGWEVDAARVGSAAALHERLGDGPWDVVIARHPAALDARAALRAVVSADRDLPCVVVVAGDTDGELAAELMRCGARDVVAEEGLARLGPAVARELAAAADRRRLGWAEEAERDRWRSFRAVADAAPVLLWTADAEGRARFFNAHWLTLRGTRLEEELATGWLAAVHADDREACTAAWARAVAGREGFEGEHRLLAADGRERWVATRVAPVSLPGRGMPGFMATSVDLTARKEAEEALRESEARNRSVLETAVDAVITADEDGTILWANPATEGMFGHPVEELEGKNLTVLMPEPYRSEHGRYLQRYRATGERRIIGIGREVVGLRRDGSTFPLHLSVTETWAGGRRTFTGIARDISQQKRVEAELAHQALHDALTGLPNRALLLDRLTSALARSRRDPAPIAVLFCDLDRFKAANDSLGHGAGDDILRDTAARLLRLVRPADTVARLGGDEFVLMCEGTDERSAVVVAERVLRALREPFVVGDSEVFLSASVGIAIDEAGASRPDTLVRNADQAMYQAKRRGKNRYELFDAHMRRRAVARVETERALHRALERDELRLHYQLQVSLPDRRVTGLEALLRWQHPERGLVGPGEFLPVAEDSGLIEPIGDWVIVEACRQGLRWWADGVVRHPTELWVNVSARQLGQPNLVDVVHDAVASLGPAPLRLGLEITESAIMRDAESCATTARALREMGGRLAIDDFGTGYSSLDYLKRFPVDTLKIDRTFVAGLGDDPQDAAIVTAVVGLASALDLEVVAEGVEVHEQVEALEELGCGMAQGFHFARPLPPAAVAALLVVEPAPGHDHDQV